MHRDYERIASSINYLRNNAKKQPELADVARACGLSPHYFQRLFRRWAGISPKQFLQFLTVQHARELLLSSKPVLDACFGVGLSSPGRLHDHFVTVEGVTPGDVKRMGEGLDITCGQLPGPFGPAFVAMTERGICALRFLNGQTPEEAVESVAERWPGATVRIDDDLVSRSYGDIFSHAGVPGTLRVIAQGTNFQIQVWRALLRIPPGNTCSYGQLAAYLERPAATRAVASAIGANPVAYLIPCHRVLRAGGELGGYRWGLDRKQAMLAWESARALQNPMHQDEAAETGI